MAAHPAEGHGRRLAGKGYPMNPAEQRRDEDAHMTKTLQVSGYTRRAPRDPYAEKRDELHDRLRMEVALDDMAREIDAAVRRDLERKDA